MMNKQVYEEIISVIKFNKHKRECLQSLAEQFSWIPHETLLSIHSQHYQQYTKQVHYKHRKTTSVHEYYERYQNLSSQNGDVNKSLLLEMADEVLFSPTLFARLILEEHIRRSDLLPPDVAVNSLVSQWIKCPQSIPDPSLQQQVTYCVLNDMNYGPLAENLKHSVGYQYEFLLLEKVQELGVPYLDERALRLRGYDKTPDIKLEVPIAVHGQIVNWIESKASFGDELNHTKYLDEQFWSYRNRFGSGMVLYWFGYIGELDVHKEQGITLADTFPNKSSITLL